MHTHTTLLLSWRQKQEICNKIWIYKKMIFVFKALIQHRNCCFDEHVFHGPSSSPHCLYLLYHHHHLPLLPGIEANIQLIPGFWSTTWKSLQQHTHSHSQMCVGDCAISNSVILPWFETANALSFLSVLHVWVRESQQGDSDGNFICSKFNHTLLVWFPWHRFQSVWAGVGWRFFLVRFLYKLWFRLSWLLLCRSS